MWIFRLLCQMSRQFFNYSGMTSSLRFCLCPSGEESISTTSCNMLLSDKEIYWLQNLRGLKKYLVYLVYRTSSTFFPELTLTLQLVIHLWNIPRESDIITLISKNLPNIIITISSPYAISWTPLAFRFIYVFLLECLLMRSELKYVFEISEPFATGNTYNIL